MNMRFLNSRKIAWGICIVGCLAAIVSLFFLPDLIPMHFSNGVADDFSGKIQIFLFPALEVFIAWLTGKEKVKYVLTHSKAFWSDVQYNWMINGVLGFVLVTEFWVIYMAFR